MLSAHWGLKVYYNMRFQYSKRSPIQTYVSAAHLTIIACGVKEYISSIAASKASMSLRIMHAECTKNSANFQDGVFVAQRLPARGVYRNDYAWLNTQL